jgi:hypothetical protein
MIEKNTKTMMLLNLNIKQEIILREIYLKPIDRVQKREQIAIKQ